MATQDATDVAQTARLRLSNDAFGADAQPNGSTRGIALRLTNEDGSGWLFVVYEKPDMDDADTHEARDYRQHMLGHRDTDDLLLIAPHGLSAGEVNMLVNPDTAVDVRYTLLNLAEATYVRRWAVGMRLRRLSRQAVLNGIINAGYDANRAQLVRATSIRRRYPGLGPSLCRCSGSQGIGLNTPVVSRWRDFGGEPIGVPIQMSKNWHDPSVGQWYRLYSQPTFSVLTVTIVGAMPAPAELKTPMLPPTVSGKSVGTPAPATHRPGNTG